MGFGAGEVLQGGAERVGREQAHIHLHAIALAEADFIFTLRDDFHEAREADEMFDQLLAAGVIHAGFAGDQHVEVADGVASATQGTGGGDFVDAWNLSEMGDQFVGELAGSVEQEAATDAAVILNRLQQFLLVLFAHAGQDANLAFARKFFDTFDVTNLVGAPDQGNGLGAEALNFQQVQHGGAIFLQQLGVEGEPSFFKNLLHVQQHALADAGHFQHFFGLADDVRYLVR